MLEIHHSGRELSICSLTKRNVLHTRYWQYDSWWYYKGVGSGVKTWTSRPDIFPDGFEYVFQFVYAVIGRRQVAVMVVVDIC